MRLLIAELPRFPRLGSLFAQAVPQQGGAFLKALQESACSHGVLGEEDLEPVIRLLAGYLLTYALGSRLFAPDGIPQPHPPERVATLILLVLRGIANTCRSRCGSPRAKRSDMRWTPEGFDAVLALRTAVLNQS
jgi:hypothetical protein